MAMREREIMLETSSFDILAVENENLQKELKAVAFEHFKLKKRQVGGLEPTRDDFYRFVLNRHFSSSKSERRRSRKALIPKCCWIKFCGRR